MYYVVIRPWGFMESVLKEEIGTNDDVLFSGTTRECNNFIHGIK